MDKIYYQPNHLWKGQKAVRKLKELSGEKPKTVKQWLSRQAFWEVHLPAPKRVDRPHYEVTIPNEMHQFDLLYMPSDSLYGTKYKYILAGIDAASRYKVARLLRMKQALDHGLVLERIHRVIQFKQSAWMKEYIDFNTRLRMVAKNDFKKDFYKLMNNSVFRKMMENIRKHRDIKLVNNKEDYLKQVMKPNFKGGVLMGADLMSCKMGKVKVKMNKPVYLGQAILDLSKTIMYEFHYDYMK